MAPWTRRIGAAGPRCTGRRCSVRSPCRCWGCLLPVLVLVLVPVLMLAFVLPLLILLLLLLTT